MPCSIIIPTKDRPAGLEKAVTSALAALPEGGEVIVIDDKSSTPAAETLAPLACDALKIFVNPGPNGPSGARNMGAAQAANPVLFFLDDDDVLLPEYCRNILAILPDLPSTCGFGFSAALHEEVSGPRTYHPNGSAQGPIALTAPLNQRLGGLGMGFWIKRAIFLDFGGLDTALRVNEDTEFSIRLARHGVQPFYSAEAGVVLIHDPVRDTSDQKSITRAANAAQRFAGFEYLLTAHADFLLDHGYYRRKLLLRSIKYRSRARDMRGWISACRRHRPRLEAAMFAIFGTVWLYLSISIRRLRKSPSAGNHTAS